MDIVHLRRQGTQVLNYLRRQEARCHQLVPRQRPQGRCRQNARGREPCLLAWRPSSALLTHKTSWSKPGLQQCSKTPSPSRPTRRSLGPKRDLNEVETAGEPEIPTEETTGETAEATTAAENADVVNKAKTTIKEATNKQAANKEADHSNHESIAGRMAYAPTTVPPAPPRKPATRPLQPCITCRMAAPNSVSGCDGVGPT